ncbi:MAG: glutamine synthetase III [Prevotellaceae bacterium]|jgi:glutamine synthetase|nr:glutamine synthetase III [Prevotellaceae bacterium]
MNSEYAKYVFAEDVMKQRLDIELFNRFKAIRDEGKALSESVADRVAEAMRLWAMENGATHYTHWFIPLTGLSAGKHEAFLSGVKNDHPIYTFSGNMLIKGEGDASSLPSGGLRATFEARGYTAWDPTSPAFILGTTLYIPTAFYSYHGEALDQKTPLLRSMQAVNAAATRLLHLLGETDVKSVKATVGAEQEYFLIDRDYYSRRLDLMVTGRTLFGAKPPKGQELGDHYYSRIRTRVMAFMEDLDRTLWSLGVPSKTRHNETAPAQYEVASIFSTVNIALDHNQLVMQVIRSVARRHNFGCLLHEKPFDGVNGSGKHNNWSLATDGGENLLSPGDNPAENTRFLLFLAAVIRAVDRYGDLIRLSASSHSNDLRLGGHEAPPAIISVFLGSQISAVLDKVASSKTDEAIAIDKKAGLKLGVGQIPELFIDNTDRNRTSPFAFTGNRFEFRAVGSSENCGAAMIALNAAVAHQLGEFLAEVETLTAKGEAKEKAIFEVVKRYIKESAPIRFDGNGYSDEWKAEAKKRGLDCETSVPVIFDSYLSESSVKMFEDTGIFNKKELHSRCEVKWETYVKKIQIESRVLGDLAMNHIIPVATEYQSKLLDNVSKMAALFPEDLDKKLSAQNRLIIERIAGHTSEITLGVEKMTNERKVANKIESEREKALAYHNNVVPSMDAIRYHIDKLELIVDNEMWPLPKYRELLFVR